MDASGSAAVFGYVVAGPLSLLLLILILLQLRSHRRRN